MSNDHVSKTRIALVVPSAGNGMAPLAHSLIETLSADYEVFLAVGGSYPYALPHDRLHRLPTAKGKAGRALAMLDPRGHSRLVQAIAGFAPDVVHVFNGEGYPWSLTLARWCARRGAPLVTTIHDPRPHPNDLVGTINGVLARYTIGRSSLVHLFDDGFLEEVERTRRRPVAIADYTSISDFYLKHRKPGAPREDMVLLFGRLEPYKGIAVFTEAALRLPPGMKAVIAGPGAVDAASRTIIEGNPERFELHERFLTDAEVAELFQRARVLALPYLEVTQSQLHAIAADFGVPTVASDIGYFSRQIPRYGGLLAPPGDPQRLAAAITAARALTPVVPNGSGAKDALPNYRAMYARARALASANGPARS